MALAGAVFSCSLCSVRARAQAFRPEEEAFFLPLALACFRRCWDVLHTVRFSVVLCKSATGGGLWRKRCGALIYAKKSNWDQPQALISYCARHSLRKITWCTDQLRVGYTMKHFFFTYLF